MTSQQKQLQLPHGGGQGRLRSSLDRIPQDKAQILRAEGDVEDKNSFEKVSSFSDERAADSKQLAERFHCEHQVLVPRQRQLVLADGPADGRRPALPLVLLPQVFRDSDE